MERARRGGERRDADTALRVPRVLVSGAGGKMGTAMREYLAESAVLRLFAGVDPTGRGAGEYLWYPSFDLVRGRPDAVVDFSHHTALPAVADYALSVDCPLVVATTGHTPDENERMLRAAEKIPVFRAANFSLGAALLTEFTRRLAAVFPEGDMEIVEAHHTGKRDAPGGTAFALYQAVREARPRATANPGRRGEGLRTKNEVGIHALRLGMLPGTHSVLLATPEEGLTLTHTAYTPRVFAAGAARAVLFLIGASPGLSSMADFLYRRGDR